MIALELKNVSKVYSGNAFRLGPINLRLLEGESLAVFGKNGAGKSSFFQLITGNLEPNEGEVYVLGERMGVDRFQLKRKLGYLPQHFELPQWVTGSEILRYGAALYQLEQGEQKVLESLKYWDCIEFMRRPLGSCSHGMKKRIGLSLATLHDPEVLILDEPFSGLDIYHIRALTSLLGKRAENKKTTILCTHIVPYAANLCQRAILLMDGQMQELADWPALRNERRIAAVEHAFFS